MSVGLGKCQSHQTRTLDLLGDETISQGLPRSEAANHHLIEATKDMPPMEVVIARKRTAIATVESHPGTMDEVITLKTDEEVILHLV